MAAHLFSFTWKSLFKNPGFITKIIIVILTSYYFNTVWSQLWWVYRPNYYLWESTVRGSLLTLMQDASSSSSCKSSATANTSHRVLICVFSRRKSRQTRAKWGIMYFLAAYNRWPAASILVISVLSQYMYLTISKSQSGWSVMIYTNLRYFYELKSWKFLYVCIKSKTSIKCPH